MSEIDSGGMAFPVTPTDRSGQIGPTEYGLTKREWYAGMALQGMLAANHMEQWRGEMTWPQQLHAISIDAYSLADAMIRAMKVDSPCQPNGVVGKWEAAK